MKISTKAKLISTALVEASLAARVERIAEALAGWSVGCGVSMSRL
jgi:hypothetical protein